MLTKTPTYKLTFIWSPAHTLTETLEVVDELQVCAAFKISDLMEWIVANQARATGWNLGTQVDQLLVHLDKLRTIVNPSDPSSIVDFMELDRLYKAFEEFHPTGDSRITVNKVAESRYTAMEFVVIIKNKPVSIYLHIVQQPDYYTLQP